MFDEKFISDPKLKLLESAGLALLDMGGCSSGLPELNTRRCQVPVQKIKFFVVVQMAVFKMT